MKKINDDVNHPLTTLQERSSVLMQLNPLRKDCVVLHLYV